jgi:branched-chain amino acid transport system permease protein
VRPGREYLPLAVIVVAVVLVFLTLGGSYLIGTFTLVGLYCLSILGLVLIQGQTGQLSLGQAAFMGIAAYFTGYATTEWHWSPLLALTVAVAISVLLAALIGRVIFRLRGHFLALATLSLAIIVETIAVGWREVTGGASGMVGIPPFGIGDLQVRAGAGYYVLVWSVALVGLVIATHLTRYRLGRALAALHRDEAAAACLGINVANYKLAIFCISALYAGLAGSLYAFYSQFVAPQTFGLLTSIELVLAAILGGVWTPYGAVLGALVIKFLPEVVAPFQIYKLMVYGVIFAATMIFFPRGIAGGIQALLERVGPRRQAMLGPTSGEPVSREAATLG